MPRAKVTAENRVEFLAVATPIPMEEVDTAISWMIGAGLNPTDELARDVGRDVASAMQGDREALERLENPHGLRQSIPQRALDLIQRTAGVLWDQLDAHEFEGYEGYGICVDGERVDRALAELDRVPEEKRNAAWRFLREFTAEARKEGA